MLENCCTKISRACSHVEVFLSSFHEINPLSAIYGTQFSVYIDLFVVYTELKVLFLTIHDTNLQ